MVIKSGCVLIAGCVFVQGVFPRCAAHDTVCEVLGEPPHTHSETPSGTITIKAPVAHVSNTSPGIITLNLGDNLARWGDEVKAEI